jgi:23S rRNA pseudouridine2604 synthase
MEDIRLNKFMADCGHCSRREADRLIEAGKVFVNGKVAETGMRVTDDDKVTVDGKVLKREEKTILLIFNKPPGITCTASKDDETNVVDYIGYPKRIYPIGRLDKYSEGLLLLTNRGDLVNGIMRSRYGHEKEYIVTVDRVVDDELLRRLSSGVYLKDLDVTTKPCKCQKVARNKLSMIITQGLNRQIRRMCEALSYKVTDLKRVRILNLKLDTEEGKYREVSAKELAVLKKCLIRKK